MFNSKYSTVLTVLLILAIIAIIGLLGYLGYSIYNKYYIETSAKDIAEAYEQAHSNNTNTTTNTIENTMPVENIVIDDSNTIDIPVTQEENNNNEETTTSNQKTTTLNGYEVIGTISIPTIKIKYPILEKVTTNALKSGICYLSGPGPNQVGNTVYQGHNYRNGTMFSNLSKLVDGNDIYITDDSGEKVHYKVYKVFEAEATDGSFFNRDTGGKREITLSTCTNDALIRTIVLAKEV